MFIRCYRLLPGNRIIIEEASGNINLVYFLDDELFAILSKPINKYVYTMESKRLDTGQTVCEGQRT